MIELDWGEAKTVGCRAARSKLRKSCGPGFAIRAKRGRTFLWRTLFAKEYPNEVAGLLLLDGSHRDQNQRESAAANKDRDDFMVKQAWWGRLAPFGITRMLGREYHPQDCGRSFRTTLYEYEAFSNISPAQVRATGKLGDLPIIVISHDPQVEIAQVSNATTRSDEAVDLQMQQELSELSTRGRLLIASGERALRAGCAAGYGVRKPAAARSEFTDGGGNPHVV